MQLGIFFSKISRSPEARNRIAWSLHFSHLSRTRPSAHFAHFRVHPPTQTVPACLTVWQSVWLSCGLCRNNFIKWESRNKWNGNWVENAPWQEVGSGEKRATAPAAPAAATTIEVTTATTTAVAAALNTQDENQVARALKAAWKWKLVFPHAKENSNERKPKKKTECWKRRDSSWQQQQQQQEQQQYNLQQQWITFPFCQRLVHQLTPRWPGTGTGKAGVKPALSASLPTFYAAQRSQRHIK